MEPIKDHPRYRQRLGLIVTVAISFIFCVLSIITSSWDIWKAELIFLILSVILSIIDLRSSRIFKKKAPTWCILPFDVCFCIAYLVMYIFTCLLARSILQVYSGLAMLVCCILHAWCVWQAIHKKLQARWAREVTFVCDKCQFRGKGKWAARGERDADDETDYLLYRDSTDDDAVEIAPGGEEVEGTSANGKGKLVDEEAAR